MMVQVEFEHKGHRSMVTGNNILPMHAS